MLKDITEKTLRGDYHIKRAGEIMPEGMINSHEELHQLIGLPITKLIYLTPLLVFNEQIPLAA